MSYETALEQWRTGERRLAEAETDIRRARVFERVVERIFLELRRRLGGAFLVDELVALYESGTAWAQDVAVAAAPDDPWAWDSRIVVDAAFGRYLREASDYAGGRRLTPGAGERPAGARPAGYSSASPFSGRRRPHRRGG